MDLTPQLIEKTPKFTKDQKIAIDGIISFIAASIEENNYIIGINGAGGTGKTFITNYIITHCIYSPSLIQCATPTNKACRVLSEALHGKTVNTIQSVFGFRLDLNLEDFNPKNPQFNPKASPKLDNCKLLIIDEASMLPASLVEYICNTCFKSNIKIIFIGDESQLPPVNENKSSAFGKCKRIYTLKEIVRQDKINPISDLLKLLRSDIDNRTFDFLTYINTHKNTFSYNEKGEGFSIVNYPTFVNEINNKFSNEEYTKNIDMYRLIAYTNKRVKYWNTYIRNTIIKDADKGIITKNDLIMANETIVDEYLSTIINNSEEYIIKEIVNFTDQKYHFKGYLVKFQLVHGGEITKPLFIIDHKDNYTISMYVKIITELINAAKRASSGTRVDKWKQYYDFKRKYLLATNIINNKETILFKGDIDYGFAITSHKSQGSTYDTVFVDVKDILFDSKGMLYSDMNQILRRLYVACSRARHELILAYD